MPLDTSCPSLTSLRRSLDPADPMTEVERQRIADHVDHCEQGCKEAYIALLLGDTEVSAAGEDPWATTTETVERRGGVEAFPARLGRYRIVGRLGAGGMGVVLRGHDPDLGRDVAVKVPGFHGGTGGTEARQRFLREARAAAAVRHA